jgi:hypothetical protein
LPVPSFLWFSSASARCIASAARTARSASFSCAATGVSILATELDAKKIEVLKELLPDAKRFGVLNDPATSGRERPQKMAETARHLATGKNGRHALKG